MAARTAQIAGAGIAGLALATALGQRGWRVEVHERAAELREIGAGITLGPDGIAALAQLGALEDTIADARQVEYWSMHDERGRTVQGQYVTRDMFCCHRQSLHRALVRSAQDAGAQIHLSSPVVGASGNGLLVGDERTRRELPADLVVGADGVGSRVRRSLAQQGVKVVMVDLAVSGLRYVVPRPGNRWVTTQPEWLRDSRRVGVLPLGGDEVAVFLSCRRDDVRGRSTPLDVEYWSQTFPEARPVLELAPEDAQWRDLVEVHSSSWSVGRTVVVGDAAFAMASNLGRGAVSALVSVTTLADELGAGDDVPAALRRWEAAIRPGIEHSQAWSRRYNAIATRWPSPLPALRSAAYWSLGRNKRLNERFAGV